MDEDQAVPAQRDALIALREYAKPGVTPALHRLLTGIDESARPVSLPLFFFGVKVLGDVVTGQAEFNLLLNGADAASFPVLFFVPVDDTGTLLTPPYGDLTDGTAILFPGGTTVHTGDQATNHRLGYDLTPPKLFWFPSGMLVSAQCGLFGDGTMLGSLGFQVTLGAVHS